MSSKLICRISDSRAPGSVHELELPRDPSAWPLRVGSGEGCMIRLSDPSVPAEVAELHGAGKHFYVKALAEAAIDAQGSRVAQGSMARFEELRIGPFFLQLTWRS